MSDSPDDLPDFATLAADPEIAALLGFEPVVRKVVVEGSWTPELQREFIARLAFHGSPNKACTEMGKNRTGMTKLYNSPRSRSFRAAWHEAVELATRRRAERAMTDFVSPGTIPPRVDLRRKAPLPDISQGQWDRRQAPPGMVLNEHGEWEDPASLERRGEEARDSIARKLLRARRLGAPNMIGLR